MENFDFERKYTEAELRQMPYSQTNAYYKYLNEQSMKPRVRNWDHLLEMLGVSPSLDTVKETLVGVDTIQVEETPVDFSKCELIQVEECVQTSYDEDIDTRVRATDENLIALVGTMKLLGLENTVYNSPPVFAGFARQHVAIVQGEYVRDQEEVYFDFPVVSAELLTDKFKFITGVDSWGQGVCAFNAVSNILYSARPVIDGSEFIVFRVYNDHFSEYYLWSSEDITKIDCDGLAYGIKVNNFFVRLYSSMNYCNSDYEFQNAKTYFLSLPFIEFAKKNQWNALLLNINGIDYMCPRYRTAVLTFHKGNMVDADGKAYPVDDVCYGKGLYMIGSVFHLQEEVFSSPSSSSYINKMRKNVITIDELPFFFSRYQRLELCIGPCLFLSNLLLIEFK